MNLYELRREVIGFKDVLVAHKQLIMSKLVAFNEVETDTSETRDYVNRLMGEVKHLNVTITGLEIEIKGIQRKILEQQTGEAL